mgnify:CR=1 FL=1
MNKNTALGASEVTKNIIFQEEMHKKFFSALFTGM